MSIFNRNRPSFEYFLLGEPSFGGKRTANHVSIVGPGSVMYETRINPVDLNADDLPPPDATLEAYSTWSGAGSWRVSHGDAMSSLGGPTSLGRLRRRYGISGANEWEYTLQPISPSQLHAFPQLLAYLRSTASARGQRIHGRLAMAQRLARTAPGVFRPDWAKAVRRDLDSDVKAILKQVRDTDARYFHDLEDFDHDNFFDRVRMLTETQPYSRGDLNHLVARINETLDRAGFRQKLEYFHCGHVGIAGEGHRVRNGRHGQRETYCTSCFDDRDLVVYCEDDGNYHVRDSVYYWESDECYHLNSEPDDDDDQGNYENGDRLLSYDSNVLDYLSIDPTFTSSAYGDFHMGVELETIGDGYSDTKVRAVREELGRDYLVGKRDGSLDSGGIEWVTRPTSLTTHVKKFGGWTASARGLRAWTPGCCGMHVHIDSRAFTALTLGKFLQFFNNRDNAAFIQQIAGRHPSTSEQARTYANYDVEASETANPSVALKGKGTHRYVMVNTANLGEHEADRLGVSCDYGRANTIEVRIYRASMRKERLLAQLEFTHALVMFCRVAGYRSMNGDSFLAWLRNNAGQYRNLAKWYGINNKHGNPKQGAGKAVDAVEPATA